MKWLRSHTFLLHSTAFVLMTAASVLLYFAARSGDPLAILALIALFAAGSLLALLVP